MGAPIVFAVTFAALLTRFTTVRTPRTVALQTMVAFLMLAGLLLPVAYGHGLFMTAFAGVLALVAVAMIAAGLSARSARAAPRVRR